MGKNTTQSSQEQTAHLSNPEEIVKQLAVVAADLPHIGDKHQKNGRLFFKLGGSDLIENIFNNPKLLKEFGEKFLKWKPVVNPVSITLIRQSMIDYFFTPIEQSEAWQIFWEDQCAKIRKEITDETKQNAKIAQTRDSIAGDVCFKLMSAWQIVNQQKAQENYSKICILNTIFKNFNSSNETMQAQGQDTLQCIRNKTETAITNIFSKQIDIEKIGETIEDEINNLRKSVRFKALPCANEKLLLECWLKIMGELVEEKQDTKLEEVDEGKEKKEVINESVENGKLEEKTLEESNTEETEETKAPKRIIPKETIKLISPAQLNKILKAILKDIRKNHKDIYAPTSGQPQPLVKQLKEILEQVKPHLSTRSLKENKELFNLSTIGLLRSESLPPAMFRFLTTKKTATKQPLTTSMEQDDGKQEALSEPPNPPPLLRSHSLPKKSIWSKPEDKSTNSETKVPFNMN